MKIRNVHGHPPECDACEEKSTKSLQFNSDGDRIYMCEAHYLDLRVELDLFSRKAIDPTESA